MYNHIRGTVTDIYSDRVVIEAAGVGYELFCSLNTINVIKSGEEVKLLTHLHLADGIMSLYGFKHEEERSMFRQLLLVTRVGPKLALSVLSTLTAKDVAAAIVTGNVDSLARAPGMGKKTAQRVLLELKERVSTESAIGVELSGDNLDIKAEAIMGLVSLGYDSVSAQKAVLAAGTADTIEELMTNSLRLLAKQ